MPISRKRKVKTKNKKKNVRTIDQRQMINGIEYIREGNINEIKNTRSEQEQKQFIEDVKKGNPNLEQSIQNITQSIIEIFEKYDKLYLLGALGITNLKLDGDKVDDGMSEVTLELAQSIATAMPESEGKPKPTPDILKHLISILRERQDRLRAFYMNESIIYGSTHPDANEHATKLRFNVIIERLSIRGVGYYDHVEEIFLELFSAHDDFLKENYGFTAKEFTQTLLSFEASISYRIHKDGAPIPQVGLLFMKWSIDNNIFPPVPNQENAKLFQKAYPEVTLEDDKIVAYRTGAISTLPKIFMLHPTSLVQEAILKSLSMKFGDNLEYFKGVHPGEGISESLVNLKPIIEGIDGKHYSFNLSIASRNFLHIGQELIKQKNPNYYQTRYLGNKYFSSRDNFLERKVTEIFSVFLKDVAFWPNMKYTIPGDEKSITEIDLLGIGSDETYLIEIKAGELNEDARKGGLGNLLSRLRKNVGEGASQSHRASVHILNGGGIFSDLKGKQVTVDPIKKIYKIVVTLDNFAGTLTKISMLEGNQVLPKAEDFPWIVNIYDLMVFRDMLDSKKDFNDFLDKRLALNSWGAFVSHDELYMLGHFFEHDLEFKNATKKYDYFMLGNHNHDIDKYYYSRQRGTNIEKPKRKKTNI